MNLSPTDRDKLQAYLDALEAVPIPQIVDTRLQYVASRVAVRIEELVTDVSNWADAITVERNKREMQ